MRRYYEMAFRLALTSQYHSPNKRMACVVVKGSCILGSAVNISGHKGMHSWRNGKHAEVRALRPHRDYDNATIFVARSNGLISRPCDKCIPVLKSSGIKEMVYINSDKNLVREYLR